jgi:hypothetical protein
MSKTGTTSLQAYANKHRDILKNADLYLPATGSYSGHHYALAEQLKALHKTRAGATATFRDKKR